MLEITSMAHFFLVIFLVSVSHVYCGQHTGFKLNNFGGHFKCIITFFSVMELFPRNILEERDIWLFGVRVPGKILSVGSSLSNVIWGGFPQKLMSWGSLWMWVLQGVNNQCLLETTVWILPLFHQCHQTFCREWAPLICPD